MADFPITAMAQLGAALTAAKPGDTITLGAGTWPDFTISGRVYAAPGITLRSAPGVKVTLAYVGLGDCAGITFDGFEIATDKVAFMMGGAFSERLVLRNCEIHGAIVPPDQIALKGAPAVSFGNASRDCAVINCEIHHVGSGIIGKGMVGARVIGNRIHDLRGDVMQFAAAADLLVEGNIVTDVYKQDADHCDGLQLTTGGLKARATGIVVRRNRFLRGKGRPYQGIFVNDEGSVGYAAPVIEENLVASGHFHGITVNNAASPAIRGNYVTGDAGSLPVGAPAGSPPMVPWISCVNCTGAVQAGNIATQGGQATIPLPPAGDFSAAETWWGKLTAPVDPHLAVIAGLKADLEAANTRAVGLSDALASALAKIAKGQAALAD